MSKPSKPTVNSYYLNVRAHDVRYYAHKSADSVYDYAGSDPYNTHDHININMNNNIQWIIETITQFL